VTSAPRRGRCSRTSRPPSSRSASFEQVVKLVEVRRLVLDDLLIEVEAVAIVA
jgi:hypothetical protein